MLLAQVVLRGRGFKNGFTLANVCRLVSVLRWSRDDSAWLIRRHLRLGDDPIRPVVKTTPRGYRNSIVFLDASSASGGRSGGSPDSIPQ